MIILKSFLEKRFGMSRLVIIEIYKWYMNFENLKIEKLPLIWYRSLYTYCKFYSIHLN